MLDNVLRHVSPGALPFAFFAKGWDSSIADLHNTLFAQPVMPKAAPTPQFGRLDQFPFHRIAMHLAQLLNVFALGDNMSR